MAAHITGDSTEAVAFALLEKIADAEGWESGARPNRWDAADRAKILDTYIQCLRAVRHLSGATAGPQRP